MVMELLGGRGIRSERNDGENRILLSRRFHISPSYANRRAIREACDIERIEQRIHFHGCLVLCLGDRNGASYIGIQNGKQAIIRKSPNGLVLTSENGRSMVQGFTNSDNAFV